MRLERLGWSPECKSTLALDLGSEHLETASEKLALMFAVERGCIGLDFRGIAVMTSNLWLRVVL